MSMTSKQRMLTAFDGGVPDRLPVTTHFLMPQFLKLAWAACRRTSSSTPAAGTRSLYTTPHRPDPARGEYYDPDQAEPGFLESRRIASDQWRVQWEPVSGPAASRDPLPLCHAQGHVEHGAGVRSVHGLGGRAAGEAETRHRPDRRVSPPRRSATWRRSTARPRRSASAGSCAATSVASTFSASPAPGRTPPAWSASSG